MAKRLRILAGPNGSGKTSIYNDLRDSFHWGVFVNADIIEQTLRENGEIDLSVYGVVNVAKENLKQEYTLSAQAQKSVCKLDNINIEDDILSLLEISLLDSYFSAFVASFIQHKLLDLGISFSMETVMSHQSKLDIIQLAKRKGYRVYLYYVSTITPEINVGRVRQRVAEGGHNVDETKIRSRYVRSLEQLREAILLSDRAYLFDNSGKKYQWIAEYDGATKELKVMTEMDWLERYVIET